MQHIEFLSSHGGPEDGASRGTRGQRGQSPSHFPTRVACSAAQVLPALHSGGSCSNTMGTSRQSGAEASLLTFKHCLKKSYLGSSICKGCGAAGQEADNTCQSNSNHLRRLGGSEACAPPAPAPAAPQQPRWLRLSSRIRRPIGTQQGRLQTIGFQLGKENLQDSLFLNT